MNTHFAPPHTMPQYANPANPAQDNRRPNGLSKGSSESASQIPAPPVHPAMQDVKPRLTKEQHDILEAHFQQQHKPTTTTKKGFAEALGVPLDKINNWFQNRRAKVKQDLKKQMAQYNMDMGMMQQMPVQGQMPTPQSMPQQQPQPQPQPQPTPQPQPQPQAFFRSNLDMSSSSLLGNGFAVQPTSQEIVPHQVPTQDFSHHGHGLQSISESTQPASYDAVMQSLVNAGYPIQTSNSSSMPNGHPAHDPYMTYDPSGLTQPMSGDGHFAFSDFPGSSDAFGDAHFDFGNDSFDFSTLATSAPASLPTHPTRASVSNEASPYSGNQSTPPSQTSGGAGSIQAGWVDEQNPGSTPHYREDSQDPMSMPGGQTPGAQWMPQFRPPMYQHSNTSSQTLMSSGPDPGDPQMLPINQSDFGQPFTFSDEAYTRRDSPAAAALAQSMSNVELQGPSSSEAEFRQPEQPSSIAARRQRPRPAALGQAALRSQSYSAGMPTSPGANHTLKADQPLRRIRSTGLVNGRIQKVNPGSAQRSPMHFSFAEAAASPKFAMQTTAYAGGSLNSGPLTTGSLAPPTPLTPSEVGRFPAWQQSPAAGNKGNTSAVGDYSGAPGSGVVYSMAPTSAACFTSAASPPETPLSLAQSLYGHRARISNGSIFKDTPPQSAPATQQSFPRSAFVVPPTTTTTMTEEPAPVENPSITGQPSQRRPSLPEPGFPQSYDFSMQYLPMVNAEGELQMAHPMHFAQEPMFHKQHPMNFSHDGGPMMAGPVPTSQAELYVHEYAPPGQGQSQGQTGARQQQQRQDMQPKNYVFANQTPGDFKASAH